MKKGKWPIEIPTRRFGHNRLIIIDKEPPHSQEANLLRQTKSATTPLLSYVACVDDLLNQSSVDTPWVSSMLYGNFTGRAHIIGTSVFICSPRTTNRRAYIL